MENRGNALVAWDKVFLPKDQGGLGVLDLATHNKCLVMKHFHKFLNKDDLPWVKLLGSFWWTSIIKSIPEFKSVARCSLGQGNVVLVWQDNWGENILEQRFCELYSFARNANVSVQECLEEDDEIKNFHTPLSLQACQQYQELRLIFQYKQIREPFDQWTYPWKVEN